MLPKNPLTIVGTLDLCWLFAYQTPVEEAQRFIPRELELVTRGGFAFWNVVVCHLHAMRPKGFPSFAGVSYWHIAYRLYVRLHPAAGPPIEGLYFARSDADSGLMAAAGNRLTDYHFHTAGVQIAEEPSRLRIAIESPDAPAEAVIDRERPPELPAYSAFSSLEEAAVSLKYKPFGISIQPDGQANVVAIRRDEAAWKSRLVHVASGDWRFFEGKSVRPEICYEVEPIDYQWNRGQLYRF